MNQTLYNVLILSLKKGRKNLYPIQSGGLAQAYVHYHQCTPFGIYAEEEMVGYVMVIFDYDENTYNIWHMMIDKNHQNKGYGKRAFGEILNYILSKPFGESDTILISCNPQNKIAYNMYCNLGFMQTGRSDGDEVELSYSIAKTDKLNKN